MLVFIIMGVMFCEGLVAQEPFKEKSNPNQPQIFHQIDTQRNSNPVQQTQPTQQRDNIGTINAISNQRNSIVGSDTLKNTTLPPPSQNETNKISPVNTDKRSK